MYEPLKYCFYKILENKIEFPEGEAIPVLTQFSPEAHPYALTIVQQGGVGETKSSVTGILSPLDEDHPYYDEENPDEKYLQTRRIKTPSTKVLSLHGWAKSAVGRDSIFEQMKACIREALSFNYKYCANFKEGKCSTTDEDCDATTVVNRFSISGKCPYLDVTDEDDVNYRNPSTYFELCGVRMNLKLHGVKFIEETDSVPETYRFIQDITVTVEEVTDIPVAPICEVTVEDEEFIDEN